MPEKLNYASFYSHAAPAQLYSVSVFTGTLFLCFHIKEYRE